MSTKSRKSFCVGDVVRYKGLSTAWTLGEEHIISEVEFNQGEFEYATNYGAWFGNEDFELVHEATRDSLQQLTQELEEEYEDTEELL